MTFKVGDRVRRTGCSWQGIVKGNIYTVLSHARPTDVILLEFPHLHGWNEAYELVEAAPVKTPHKHAELIKAWADDPTIVFEWRSIGSDYWFDFGGDTPDWDMKEIRIKPEPKPDVVREARVEYVPNQNVSHIGVSIYSPHNAKFTFDGETGKLKAVELINKD